MQKILFIGGTGMLGQPVARELINAGFSVRFLARDPAKMEKLYPGHTIFKGDLFDRDSLRKAFTGQDIIYLSLSVAQSSRQKNLQPEREGMTNIIAIARETGVPRIAYLSSLVKNYQGTNGFNWWAFDIKQKAVEAVRSSGLSYSIFYPSSFMETLDHQMLRGKRLLLVKGSVSRMWFIAATDYGKQVAKAFAITVNNQRINQEYSIQGESGLDWKEAGKIFTANYKKGAKILSAPLWLLKFFGLFSPTMNYGAHICEALNKYPEKFESQRTWKDLGKPVTTLEEYVKGL